MGIVADVIRRLAPNPTVTAVTRRLIVPADRWVERLTGRRRSLVGALGFPDLQLTVVGRTSGQPRTVTLMYGRDGDRFVLAATNFGQPRHPLWSENLLAHPDATVVVDGREVTVRARLAEGAEKDRLWALMQEVYPYERYRERAGREIRVFVLEPRISENP